MAKKLNSAKLKNKLWLIFGEFVRLRDSYDGYGTCISCGKKVPYPNSTGDFHAGHLYPRSTTFANLYFSEINVNGQCLTKESHVHTIDGGYESIADVNIGDKILGFDEDTYEKMETTVVDIHSFMPDELYEVELQNGDKFWATGDHRVVSNGEWVKIEDMLQRCTGHDILEL